MAQPTPIPTDQAAMPPINVPAGPTSGQDAIDELGFDKMVLAEDQHTKEANLGVRGLQAFGNAARTSLGNRLRGGVGGSNPLAGLLGPAEGSGFMGQLNRSVLPNSPSLNAVRGAMPLSQRLGAEGLAGTLAAPVAFSAGRSGGGLGQAQADASAMDESWDSIVAGQGHGPKQPPAPGGDGGYLAQLYNQNRQYAPYALGGLGALAGAGLGAAAGDDDENETLRMLMGGALGAGLGGLGGYMMQPGAVANVKNMIGKQGSLNSGIEKDAFIGTAAKGIGAAGKALGKMTSNPSVRQGIKRTAGPAAVTGLLAGGFAGAKLGDAKMNANKMQGRWDTMMQNQQRVDQNGMGTRTMPPQSSMQPAAPRPQAMRMSNYDKPAPGGTTGWGDPRVPAQFGQPLASGANSLQMPPRTGPQSMMGRPEPAGAGYAPVPASTGIKPPTGTPGYATLPQSPLDKQGGAKNTQFSQGGRLRKYSKSGKGGSKNWKTNEEDVVEEKQASHEVATYILDTRTNHAKPDPVGKKYANWTYMQYMLGFGHPAERATRRVYEDAARRSAGVPLDTPPHYEKSAALAVYANDRTLKGVFERMEKSAVIEKLPDGQYALMTSDGKRRLGTHPTRQAAIKQEYAIQKSEESAA